MLIYNGCSLIVMAISFRFFDMLILFINHFLGSLSDLLFSEWIVSFAILYLHGRRTLLSKHVLQKRAFQCIVNSESCRFLMESRSLGDR